MTLTLKVLHEDRIVTHEIAIREHKLKENCAVIVVDGTAIGWVDSVDKTVTRFLANQNNNLSEWRFKECL